MIGPMSQPRIEYTFKDPGGLMHVRIPYNYGEMVTLSAQIVAKGEPDRQVIIDDLMEKARKEIEGVVDSFLAAVERVRK